MTTLEEVYNAFKKDGAPLPDTYEEFHNYMTSGPNNGYNHRKQWYDAFKADGAPLPDTYEEFSNALFKQHQGSGDYFKLRRGGKDFTVSADEVRAAGGLQNWAQQHPGAPLRVYMQGRNADGTDFNGHVDLSDAHDRSQNKGYKYSMLQVQKQWHPTAQDKIKSAQNIDRSINGFKEKTNIDDTRRMLEPLTEEGRNRRKAMKSAAQLVGVQSEAPKISPNYTPPTLETANNQSQEQQPQNKYGSTLAPQVSRVIVDPETGEARTEWVTGEGKITDSAREMAYANTAARQARQDAAFRSRMRERGLDPKNEADVELQQAYEYEKQLDEALNKRRKQLDEENSQLGFGTKILREIGSVVNSDKHGITLDEERYHMDDQYNQLMAAARNNRNAISVLEDKHNKTQNEFWLSLGKEMINGYTFSGGMSELSDARALVEAASLTDEINRKRREGEALTDEERTAELLLRAVAQRGTAEGKYGSEYGAWARAGKTGAHSIELMLDFALGGAQITKTATTKILTKMGLDAMTKGVKRAALKFTGTTLGTLAGGALMANTISAPRTLADASRRSAGDVYVDENGDYVLEGESFGTALLNAERDMIADLASEAVGAYIPGVGKMFGVALNKLGLSKLAGAMAKMKGTAWYGATQKVLERTGYNGIVGEGLEEYAGMGYSALMGNIEPLKSTKYLDTHVDIWLGVATLGGILNVPQTIGTGMYGISYTRQKHKLNSSDKKAAAVFDEDWDAIREKLDECPNETMGALVAQMLRDGTLDDVKRREALLGYVGNLQRMRGFSLADMAASAAGETNGEDMARDRELSDAYDSGYNAATPQEMVDAQNTYELQRQRLVDELVGVGDEAINTILNDVDSDPVGALRKTDDPNMRDILLSYANAKTRRDAIIERVNDDIEIQIAQSDAMVDSHVNRQTGMIHYAAMGLDNRPVYIVDGNVAVNEDGSINREASDESIIVRDAISGELEFTDPKSIASVEEPIDPEAERTLAADAIRQQRAQEAANVMNGTLAFNPGDAVSINNGGEFIEGNVIGPAPDANGMPVDGQVVVALPDGQQAVYIKEQLQSFADAANRERIAAAEQERATVRSQQQAQRFALNDEYVFTSDGTEFNGRIVEVDEDNGTIGLETDVPVNGARINYYTPDELEELIDTYNGVKSNPTVEGEQPEQPVKTALLDPRTMSDEEKARRGDMLRNTPAIDVAQRQIVSTKELSARKAAEKWWDENVGESAFYDTEVGEVEINRNSVESSLAHRYGQMKLDAITSLVEGFEDAVYLGTMPDSRERGVIDHYFAYPIDYDGKRCYVFCRAMQDANKNRLYVHEVFVSDKIKQGDTLQTAASKPHGGIALYRDILANVLSDSKDNTLLTEEQAYDEKSSQTALSRVPLGENGKPDFLATDENTAWDAIVEKTGSEITANAFAENMVKLSAEALKKAEKAKIKPTADIDEFTAAENERLSAIDRAKYTVDQWTKIAGVKERRESERRRAEDEARRVAEEAEREKRAQAYHEEMARRQSAYEAEMETRRREREETEARRAAVEAEAEAERQLPENIEREAVANNFEDYFEQLRERIFAKGANERRQELQSRISSAQGPRQYGEIYEALSSDDLTPTASLEEWVTRALSLNPQRVRWNGHGNLKGQIFATRPGTKVGEYKQLQWMISDQNGVPFMKFVHGLWEALSVDDSAGFNREDVTDADMRDMVIEVLRSHPTSRSLFKSAIEMYDARSTTGSVRGELEELEHYRDDIRDQWYRENLGLTYDEYNQYVEVIYDEIRRSELTDEDVDAINNIIAKEEAERLNGNENERNDEGALHSGAENLQAEQSDKRPGDAAPDGDRPETTGGRSDNEGGTVQPPSGRQAAVAGDVEYAGEDISISGIEYLDKEVGDALIDYVKRRWSAPITVIRDIADIENDAELPDEAKEQLKEIFASNENPGVFSTKNKKIYIFAGRCRTEREIKTVLRHENTHAAVHALGEQGREFAKRFHDILGSVDEKTIKLIENELPKDYAPDRIDDEFIAYVTQEALRLRRFRDVVLGTLGPKEREYYLNNILKAVYGISRKEAKQSNSAERNGREPSTDDSEKAGSTREAEILHIHSDEDIRTARRDNGGRGGRGDSSTEGYGGIGESRQEVDVLRIPIDENIQATRRSNGGRGGRGRVVGDQQAVDAASSEINPHPIQAQKEAGNYRKGHITLSGLDITIENAAGSERSGTDANGKSWRTTMANAYGYIRGTKSVDGDHIDVFLHNDMDQWDGQKVFVVDQTNEDGSFDEHKVMLGFNDKEDALKAYFANYDKAWADTHPGVLISETGIDDFHKWLDASDRKTKPFAEYATVRKVTKEVGKAGYSVIEERDKYFVEHRIDKEGNIIFAIRLKKGAKHSVWKDAVGEYGMYSSDGYGDLLFDTPVALTEFLQSRGEPTESLTAKIEWDARDREIDERLHKEYGLRKGQEWVAPDGTRVTIGKRGFVKGPRGWSFSASITYPDGRKESAITDVERILSVFKDKGFKEVTSEGTPQIEKIEDFGEKIAGARKDLLNDIARSIENVSVQSLIELPMSKAFKRPNVKKLIDAGVISDSDAALAEAVIYGLIYAKSKPVATRSPRRKREIEQWANETYEGIKLLGEVLSGNRERLEKALAGRKAKLAEQLAEMNGYIDKLREWNPGKNIPYKTEIPDEVDVIRRVLDGIGYQPGDKIELPLTRVVVESYSQSVSVDSAGKQGARWFKKFHNTLDEAIGTMIFAARLARGDRDVEIPQRYISVKGVGKCHAEPNGKYEVLYFGKNDWDVKSREFSSREEAEAFAATKNGRVREMMKYTNEYDSYTAVVTNPMTGNSLPVGKEYPSRTELSEWIDGQHEELNALAVDAILKENGSKSSTRSHFYVGSSWKNGKMLFSVVANDKRNPWPIIKDFSTRKDAEEWLKANLERLESERKQRLEVANSVVYFNPGTRQGKDHRNGEHATPEMYNETFGFRGVQFGNWTNNEDRQMAMDQAYDAFMDLSAQLGLSPRAISLYGELGVSFGARGSGRASAHYEPVQVVINLTKTKGAGALAHEWWHALDNYLSRKAGVALGFATDGNGKEKMDPEVCAAIDKVVSAITKSEYGKRSAMKGDYWGRNTEMGARLFETWISERIKAVGEASPFLASGLNENALKVYQTLNYFAYRANEYRLAEAENREPQVMSEEDFYKTTKSLYGYPYPTVEEVRAFSAPMESLFKVLSDKEQSEGIMAKEPRRRYGGKHQPMVTGGSLFDWADDRERMQRQSKQNDEDATMAEEADAALDRYAESYNEYLRKVDELDSQLEADEIEADIRSAIAEQLEAEESMLVDSRSHLQEVLRQFYLRNNTPEDAERIARDMIYCVQAEVEIRRNKDQILNDVLGIDVDREIVEAQQPHSDGKVQSSSVRTAGGLITYEAQGHIPNVQDGEFAYVERKFSCTGEFSFTGNERIRDNGDVAYLFRSLEDYSIENVFAVLVKDGKGKVLHIGMGTTNMSVADMGAIRAGVDAFGADKIYLVHNHPSGNLKASVPDMRLLRTLEEAFGSKVETDGVIIDTTSGRYASFSGNGELQIYDRPKDGGKSVPEVYRFDRAGRNNKNSEEIAIRNSEDVKDYLEKLRFGNGKRLSYLILSNGNHIIGNFHTDYLALDAAGLAEEIASVASKYGGQKVIVYGNTGLAGSASLKEQIKKHSLGSIDLLDVVGVRNGIKDSAIDSGVLRESAESYGPQIVSEPMMASRGDFDAMRERAVAERGIVMPGLNEAKVRIVEVPRHDFTGDKPIAQAREWAKENIVGEHTLIDSDGKDVLYTISGRNIDKYLSGTAIDKSDNLGAHLSVLKKLPEVISESIEAEVHADYNKGGDGRRQIDSGYNEDKLIHRFYGAILLDGANYRVKTTIQESRTPTEGVRPHSFEVIEIELLPESNSSKSLEPTASDYQGQLPHGTAKLLQGVEKSYDPGKKLLDESRNSVYYRQGDTPNRNRFSKKRQAEYVARERRRMAARVQELAERMHLDNVEIPTDVSQLEGKRSMAKGFYSRSTGKITIVIPNNHSTLDAEQTLLHEAVAHYGLRRLFGEHFNTFLDNVYQAAEMPIRRKIAEMAAKNGWDFRTATEEYLASLAEDTNFEEALNYGGWWSEVKRLFRDMIAMLGFDSFSDKTGIVLTDNELRYILWRSYENLQGRDKGILGIAEDVAKQYELKVGNYADGGIEAERVAEADISAIGMQFDKELEAYKNGTLPKGHRFELGMPSPYLRSAGFPMLPISMRTSLLATKAAMNRHPFEASDLRGLVEALQKPIAILRYSKENMRNLIVDVKRGDKHFLVGVTLNYKAGDIEINSVSGLFPKDSLEWLKWIQDDKAIRIDQKEKVLAVIDSQRTTNTVESERIGLNLDDTAKIVKSFENPPIEEDDLYRGAEGSARKEYDERVRAKIVDKEKMKSRSTNRAAQLNEAYFDSMRSLEVLQEAVSHESGKPIKDFENAYIAENQMSSRNKVAEEAYKRDLWQPLCDAIAELTKGKDENYRTLLDYIMAKHGLERNKYMRKNVRDFNTQLKNDHNLGKRLDEYPLRWSRDFAGLTALMGKDDWRKAEDAARQMASDYEKTHNTAELWSSINAATAEILHIRYQGGLLSKDMYDKIRKQYKYYIPLKGWAEETAMDVYEYAANGYGLKSALMAAQGRLSLADDPLATIMVDAQRTIMEANRNKMKQHFLNLALNHQTSLLTLSRQWYVLDADGEWSPDDKLVIPPDADADTVDALVKAREKELLGLEKQGKATTRRSGLKLAVKQTDAIADQHVVKVKRNGETYCIYVNGDPRAARAINGMLNPDSGEKSRAAKVAQEIKNFMSKAFTTWNPEFVVGNLSRDLMFAGTAVAIKENRAYTVNYTKNITSLFFNYHNMLPGLLYKWEHGTLNDTVEIERLFKEFLKNGGETGFTQLNTVEKTKKEMQRFLKEAQGGAAGIPSKAWRGFWNGVEFLNRSAEDTTRFAVYMTSRQQGRSVSRSIYDAKEITVNFNKKGSGALGAKYLNFAYIFFNAAMQALANAGRLVYRNPGKASIAMGIFMSSGFFFPLISGIFAGLWGDGDDDYWNLPEWVRRNNVILDIPFTKKYLTIPIAHELRPFYGIGEIVYSIMRGKETVEDGLWKAVEGFTGLLPVDYTGNGGNLKANLAPTILQPLVQVDQNVDYFGKPIYKNTPWNTDDPEWTKAYKNTSGLLVDATRMFSEALSTTDEYGVTHYPEHWYTGDINPAVIEHLVASYTGGLGKTVIGIGKTISMLWNEDARELRNVPVVRKFVQSSNEQAEAQRFSNEYFKIKDEYDKSKKYLRDLGKLDDEGALGVADRVNRWLDTDVGKRHELLDEFFKEVNSYQRELDKEDNDGIRNLIKHDIDSVKHKLVETIDSLNSVQAKQE